MVERLLHDLKQPLNLIRVIAQDLRLDVKRNRLEVDSVPENMKEIEQTVDKLASQIDQLRSFAKPDLSPQAACLVDPGAACKMAAQRLREAYPHVQPTVNLPGDLPLVKIDAGNMEQAIFELACNGVQAGDAAPDGRPHIEILAFTRNKELVISVQDHGTGVPEHIQIKIFEPFFTTREHAAGLGLALTYAIVKERGGRIELAQTGPTGSRFELSFPELTWIDKLEREEC